MSDITPKATSKENAQTGPASVEQAMDKEKQEKHHYIPVFYLRYFGDGETPARVWVHERGRAEPYRKGPRRIAYIPDFYAVDEATGVKKDAIEKNVLGVVESWIPPIVARVEQRSAISEKEKERLAIFVAFMHTRVPRFKQIVDRVHEQSAKRAIETMAQHPERLEAIRLRVEEDTGERFDISTEALREFMKDDTGWSLRSHRALSLNAMLFVSAPIAGYILGMTWTFCHAVGNARFITSDVPVVLADPKKHPTYDTGFALPEAEMTLPLTPRLLMLASYRANYPGHAHFDAPDVFVKGANRWRILFGDRYLFASTRVIHK